MIPSRLHIAIFCGKLSGGWWSVNGGEGRWPLSLAYILSQDPRIKIDLIGDSGGPQGGLGSNIRCMLPTTPAVREQIYDIALLAPWELKLGRWLGCEDYQSMVQARLYVHPTFSWNVGLLKKTCYKLGHILAIPFPGTFVNSPKPGDPGWGTFKVEVIPYPFVGDPLPPDPSRREIVWPSKDVFHTYWKNTDHRQIADLGISYLKALLRLCRKYPGIRKVHFLTGKWNFNPRWSKRTDHIDLAKQLPDPVFHDWVKYDELLDIFARIPGYTLTIARSLPG